jgi:hypothetical protein
MKYMVQRSVQGHFQLTDVMYRIQMAHSVKALQFMYGAVLRDSAAVFTCMFLKMWQR